MLAEEGGALYNVCYNADGYVWRDILKINFIMQTDFENPKLFRIYVTTQTKNLKPTNIFYNIFYYQARKG